MVKMRRDGLHASSNSIKKTRQAKPHLSQPEKVNPNSTPPPSPTAKDREHPHGIVEYATAQLDVSMPCTDTHPASTVLHATQISAHRSI
jgi:hypothetical protein